MRDRASAQRPKVELLVVCVERVPKVDRLGTVAAPCQQDSDWQIAEPSRCEPENPPPRTVQPLNVIDGDEHGLVSGQQAEERQESKRQGERLGGRPLRRPQTKRGREHCTVVIGKLACYIAEPVANEIG